MAKSTNRMSGKPATIHDQKLQRGEGGELHQQAQGATPVLTTAQGGPVADDQNSLKIGARGPTALEDFHLREKIFHFDHERIPERVVHARGYGAHGYFETYKSLAKYTRADIFQRAGEKTPAFVRFSTVAGSKGSVDLARDVRGFAVKLYTKEGNWDIVGNSIPVFFIQDAIKFPDIIHAVKPEPDSGFQQAQSAHDNFWDFISLTPESMHMIMWVMSDRAIPRSFRFMEGFGVHTFRMVNARDESTFVKFHWKPKLGLQSVVWNEAVKINGADPDFHRRDLWEAIKAGSFPEWELQVQLFDQNFADSFDFDVLDATKLIPEELLPPIPVGRLVLDRMPDNFFAETEQVAFMTQNVPPGIDFSNDPLPQGRNFSYLDTQLKRLGSTNFTHLPINAPKCPFHHFQQDGHMAMRNPVGRANYQPNSWGEGPRESPQAGFRSFADAEGGPKQRIRAESFADHYSQARQFFRSQTAPEQRHIAMALTFELSKVETPAIRERMVAHLRNIDEGLATTVADKLGIKKLPAAADAAVAPRDDLQPSPALSIVENGPDSFAGRKVGVLVSAGADAALLKKLQAAIEKEGAVMEVVAPKVGGVEASDGSWIEARHMIDGGPSVLFDAVALLVSEQGAERLTGEAAARDFVADAFAHCKFIAFTSQAVLLEKAGVDPETDEGLVPLDDAKAAKAFVETCRKLRLWSRETAVKLLTAITGADHASHPDGNRTGPLGRGPSSSARPVQGEGGESVIVAMADVDSLAGDEAAAIERAKAVLVQTATFDTAVNAYDAQSNGNFDQVTETAVTDQDGGVYIFEYRDGESSRRVPPAQMPSLEAAREEVLRCAVELLADLDLNTGPIPDWLIRIYDDHGDLLAVVDVHQANAARLVAEQEADSRAGS